MPLSRSPPAPRKSGQEGRRLNIPEGRTLAAAAHTRLRLRHDLLLHLVTLQPLPKAALPMHFSMQHFLLFQSCHLQTYRNGSASAHQSRLAVPLPAPLLGSHACTPSDHPQPFPALFSSAAPDVASPRCSFQPVTNRQILVLCSIFTPLGHSSSAF